MLTNVPQQDFSTYRMSCIFYYFTVCNNVISDMIVICNFLVLFHLHSLLLLCGVQKAK